MNILLFVFYSKNNQLSLTIIQVLVERCKNLLCPARLGLLPPNERLSVSFSPNSIGNCTKNNENPDETKLGNWMRVDKAAEHGRYEDSDGHNDG